MNLLQRALRKYKNEGFAGVWRTARGLVTPCFSAFRLKQPKRGFNVLYVIGYNVGESKRYRVFNLIEALGLTGASSQYVNKESLAFASPKGFDIVVFFRCKWDVFTRPFWRKCKKHGIPAVCDIDDLMFDEGFIDKIKEDENLSRGRHAAYLSEAKSYREMLCKCDASTASTHYLCDYMRRLTGKEAYCIPNGINKRQIDIADSLKPCRGDTMKIGFISGSRTHNKDFLRAAPALLSALGRRKTVTLTIIGFLDLPEEFSAFKERVTFVPYMGYLELLKYCAELYAVIVPLEYEQPFCEAKSELKYFEQALAGVPVIASPTDTYKRCIAHGVNGLLASNDREWEECLESLVTDRDYRDALAENARRHVRDIYYPGKIGEAAKRIYLDISGDN